MSESDQPPISDAPLARRRGPKVKAKIVRGGARSMADIRQAPLPETEPEPQRKVREARRGVRARELELGEFRRRGEQPPSIAFDSLEAAREALRQAERERAAAQVRDSSVGLDAFDEVYREGMALPPYVDPDRAIDAVVASDILTRCITTLATNVGGYGHEMECAVSTEARAKLSKEVNEEIEREKLEAESFFRFINPDMPFQELRYRRDVDKEITGYGVWEFLRRGDGKIAAIEHLPSWSMRLGPLSPDYVMAEIPVQDESGRWQMVQQERRFRIAVQIVSGKFRYFKMLGDPRVVDRYTGETADPNLPEEAERAKEIKAANRQARECWFFVHYGVSGGKNPHGVPRWAGSSYSAIGRKKAAMINLDYFDNKAVPPLAILISGGSLTKSSFKLVQELVNGLKGAERFNDVLILEAQTPPVVEVTDAKDASAAPRIELKPLSEAMNKDSVFAGYAKDALTDVQMTFGIPPILLGMSSDYTRATADTAKIVADQQVFQPERMRDDFFFNNVLFPRMDIRWWRFKSKGAALSDETTIAEVMDMLMRNGALFIDEARAIGARLLNTLLPKVGKPWANRPVDINLGQAKLGVDYTLSGADLLAAAALAADATAAGNGGDGGGDGASDVGADAAAASSDAEGTGRAARRFWRVGLSADLMRTARVVNGMLHLRQDAEEELAAKLGEARRELEKRRKAA